MEQNSGHDSADQESIMLVSGNLYTEPGMQLIELILQHKQPPRLAYSQELHGYTQNFRYLGLGIE